MCGEGDGEDFIGCYLITHIIPSGLITLMIIIALIIACLLSRRSKKYFKQNSDDDTLSARVYLKKGAKCVPIILEDELEDELFNNREHSPKVGHVREELTPISGVKNCPDNLHRPENTMQFHRVLPSQSSMRNGIPLPPDYPTSVARSKMRTQVDPMVQANLPR